MYNPFNRISNKSGAVQPTTSSGEYGGEGKVDSLNSTNKQVDCQIKGFGRCLDAFLASNKVTKSDDQDQHLCDVFSKISLDQMPKVFKMSLAQRFSIELKQELPDTDGISIPIFSKNQEAKLLKKSCLMKSESDQAKFWFKLLQCKDLANPVPKSMIQESYEKHRKVLSAIRKTPDDILLKIRSYARQFAESVKQHYTGNINLALTTAPYECTRQEGGTRKYLSDRLVFNKTRRLKTETRIDPVVLHLIGKPGLGKSFISEMLISKLSSYFGIRKADSRYSRSMACEHWDGYRNQLIAQIDDIFTERDGTEDAKQLIQMCSNAKWIVPMADLREKGREFNSEFLILSSNQRFNPSQYINCDEAIDRRVYKPAFRFEEYDRVTKLYRISQIVRTNNSEICQRSIIGTSNEVVDIIFNYAIKTYKERIRSLELIDNQKYEKAFMPIVNGNEFEFSAGYEFDPCPNTVPICKAHAIPEPLKVRMITKGEAQNWILKPLQKAMHRALKDFPCFRLTSGQSILNNFKKVSSGYYFVSGDYSAATDNLNSDVMECVVGELVKVLPSEIIPYLIREAGPHYIEYPKSSGLDPILQTNGQLMGSLISFPILCIANAATYGHAINWEDLRDLPCLINGDDISFRDSLKNIKKWKRVANLMGLIPSVGKNYLSRTWFTINSQICTSGVQSNRINVDPSLAFNVLWSHKARKGEIDTIREACQRYPKSEVVKYLKSALRQTPRSLDIAVNQGGLGMKNTRKPTLIDREINLMSYLKKKTQLIKHIDEFSIVQCTKEIASKYVNLDLITSAIKEGIYPPKRPNVSYTEIVPKYKNIQDDELESQLKNEFDELHKFQRFYRTVPVLRDWIKSNKPLKNLSNSKLMTIIVHRDVYEKMPSHSMIDL